MCDSACRLFSRAQFWGCILRRARHWKARQASCLLLVEMFFCSLWLKCQKKSDKPLATAQLTFGPLRIAPELSIHGSDVELFGLQCEIVWFCDLPQLCHSHPLRHIKIRSMMFLGLKIQRSYQKSRMLAGAFVGNNEEPVPTDPTVFLAATNVIS